MPVKSSYPDVEIPAVDLWAFMFDGKRDFADSKGQPVKIVLGANLLTSKQ